jgi:uncharacterized membrane protein
MITEQNIHTLIIIHAVLGGIALLCGLVAIIAKKGQFIHKKSGYIFYISMLLSGISAIVIASLPNHENPFLIAVAIFSLYFVITGKRALTFKTNKNNIFIDKMIAYSMIIVGLFMILIPIIFLNKINIILTVFAFVGIIFSVKDLTLYQNQQTLKDKWLKLHLGKMLGAYIATTTAFVVVNNVIPNIYGWFVPGIVGGFYIIYWMRKVNL